MPKSFLILFKWLLLVAVVVMPACSGDVAVTPIQPTTAMLKTFGIHALESVDLRSRLNTPRNQGERNTCNAFAATALMEFLIQDKTGQVLDLSESYNYWQGKQQILKSPYLSDTYAHIDGLAGFLAVKAYQVGSMLEHEWPYESNNWQQQKDPRCKVSQGQPATECFTGTPPPKAKTLPFKLQPLMIERTQIGAFILKEKKPVIFNLLWVNQAVNPRTGQIRMPTLQELAQAGGHVITLVGYESKTKQFTFRNSYGDSWGNKGYGTIPEDYLIKHCEVCPHLPALATYPPEVKDFVRQSSMGVSGTLLPQ